MLREILFSDRLRRTARAMRPERLAWPVAVIVIAALALSGWLGMVLLMHRMMHE
jgi:hypothetical protein